MITGSAGAVVALLLLTVGGGAARGDERMMVSCVAEWKKLSSKRKVSRDERLGRAKEWQAKAQRARQVQIAGTYLMVVVPVVVGVGPVLDHMVEWTVEERWAVTALVLLTVLVVTGYLERRHAYARRIRIRQETDLEEGDLA